MRLPPTIVVVALAPLLLTACGDGATSGADGACGPIRREALDKQFLVHVLGDAEVQYTSDPPTSGPHQPTPAVSGVRSTAIPRPLQVGILEAGDVLLQHRPDLPRDQRTRLEALAGEGVVVAPNADLDDAVVATAWLYKRSCSSVDASALEEFVHEREGKGPGSDAP